MKEWLKASIWIYEIKSKVPSSVADDREHESGMPPVCQKK